MTKPSVLKVTPETLIARLTLQVFKLQGQLLLEGERLTQGSNLTGTRLRVLGVLIRNMAEMTVPQIAREMGLARQSVQRLTDVMANDGFVRYIINPAHSKSKLLELTELGQVSYKALAKPQRESLRTMAGGLDSASMSQTIEVLQAIGTNLETTNPSADHTKKEAA